MSCFQKMCTLLAAKQCYEAGQSVAQIAASAKVSAATVRRWLKNAGVIIRK